MHRMALVTAQRTIDIVQLSTGQLIQTIDVKGKI